jgi:hypothetical protein
MTACPASWAMEQLTCRFGEKKNIEQPRQNKNLLYLHELFDKIKN